MVLGIDLKKKGAENTIFSGRISLTKGSFGVLVFWSGLQKILKHFDIDVEVLYADFDWDVVLKSIQQKILRYDPFQNTQK